MNLSNHDIKNALDKSLIQFIGPEKLDHNWTQWSTDSREKKMGAIFIALVGEKFDAHDFLFQAYQNGARGFLVQAKQFVQFKTKADYTKMDQATFFVVNDTEMAFQKISAKSASKHDILKVAITGTTGKTSAKYFSHQILEGLVPHYFSPKSFNNHIGVPMTLLELKPEHKVALIEIGMNRPGEIAKLTDLVKPNVSVITMVGRGHLEGVGSIEGVLREKMNIYNEGQTHLINIDDPRIWKDYQEKFSKNLNSQNYKLLRISTKDETADIYLKVVHLDFSEFEIEGRILGVSDSAKIPIAGEHHVYNVAIAAGVAVAAGIQAEKVWKQLKLLKPVWGRSEILKSKNEVSIYFDAYNANPESMHAFLKQTEYLAKPPYFVLGEMLEMGEQTSKLHYELGQQVSKTPHRKVWFIGPSSKAFSEGFLQSGNSKNLIISNTYEDSLAMDYKSMLKPNDWVALKASRGIGLERFLKDFID